MSDYIKATDKFVEPVAPVPDDYHVSHICQHCGADLFEVGVTEAIAGGYSETEIRFVDGKIETGVTSIQDFDEQWALCGRCKGRIEYTAGDIIEAFGNQHQQNRRSD